LRLAQFLTALGWFHLPQQSAGKRREDVPDALLFLDPAAQQQTLAPPSIAGSSGGLASVIFLTAKMMRCGLGVSKWNPSPSPGPTSSSPSAQPT
jgi:hypothetical protein